MKRNADNEITHPPPDALSKAGPPAEASAKAGPPPVDLSKAGLSAEALAKAGYKHTPLGWLPKEWEVVKLGKILLKSQYGLSVPSSPEGNVPIFKMNNFDNGKMSKDGVDFVVWEEELMEAFVLEKLDILFNRTNSYELVGKTGIFDLDGKYTFASYLVRFQVNGKFCSPLFVNYYLNWDRCQRKIKAIATKGVSQVNINPTSLKDWLKIPLPPLPEQQQIAAILSAWDRAIERTQALIAAKEERRRGVMQRLLTGKVRVKGFEGAWREVKVKEIFSLIEESNDGLEHTVMTISARFGLISQKEKFDRVIAGDSLKRYTLIRAGDFAYNKGNSKLYEMGCIYRLEDIESALVPFVYICFRPSGKIDSTFYKHWFLAHGLDRQLKKIITSGARGDGLLNVNKKDFFNLKVPLPPKEEQTIIGEILSKADYEVTLLQKKLEALQAQKKGLMQQLLTGKIRVK